MTEARRTWFINVAGARSIGGGETARRIWSEEFVRRGGSVTWYCPQSKEQIPAEGDMVPDGVQVRELRFNSSFARGILALDSVVGIARQAEAEQPDHIIINGVSVGWLPLLAKLYAAGFSEKLVVVFHCDPKLGSPSTSRFRRLAKAVFFCATHEIIRKMQDHGARTIAVSNLLAEKVSKLKIGVSQVIYPPPNLNRDCHPTTRSDVSRLNVATVSRLDPEKGISFLGHLSAACRAEALPVIFRLVGTSGDKVNLKTTLSKLGNGVDYVGPRLGEGLCDQYKQADVTVAPSLNEALGLNTVESLAHGAPVIARNPVAREVMGEGVGVVLPADTQAGVVMAMNYMSDLLTRKGFLPEQSQRAFAVSRSFNPQTLAGQFVDYVAQS